GRPGGLFLGGAARPSFLFRCGPVRKAFYVAIEGPLGVGKSTLARRLAARLGAGLVLDPAGGNPFLARFYRDRERYALPTQLHFLLNRHRQQEEVRRSKFFQSYVVSDYLMEKDRIFARLNLEGEEMQLYEEVWRRLGAGAPPPHLVVLLRASTEELLRRVARRDRPFERGMERDYLDALNGAYAEFFARYRGAPVLELDTEKVDPTRDEGALEELVGAVRKKAE
ncbi:MAG: deoxynucleoside kinase, partial [Nitrospinota bacterium]